MSHPPFSVCSPESADGSNSPRPVGLAVVVQNPKENSCCRAHGSEMDTGLPRRTIRPPESFMALLEIKISEVRTTPQ
ncbi:hypothetical protein BRARA_B00130 [Brassica rapa]|uniref:Uncharacterized protein n=1 Tax=Brassica campestris TaxID=3711 RepID=A0A398A8E5_BRACM|nr:hypothetical protein BRARA_B00130 [Brassica rapa]